MFSGMGGLDPSKLTPQLIAEITEAMKMLSPDQMMRLQTLMHNQMAGFNVSKEMMELEQTLPSGFREKMARLMYLANGIAVPDVAPVVQSGSDKNPENLEEARLVILRSVAGGLMSPEEALKILFADGH
jgi:hypothetical protein